MAEFRMPALGADMETGVLVAWRRKPGERLERGDIIAEVETDKGVIEVEVWNSGVLERYLVEPGQKVPVGTPLAILSDAGEPEPAAVSSAAPSAPSAQPPSAAEALQASPAVRRRARELGLSLREVLAQSQRVSMAELGAPQPSPSARGTPTVPAPAARPRSSPAARKRAQQLGVDLQNLHGTGPEGAIVLEDVERAAAAPPTAAAAGQLAREDPKRALRRAIAAAMARSKREVPHYYLTTSIDLFRAQTWLASYNRERSVNQRVLPGALLIKAVAIATKQLPEFNCLWQDEAARSMPDVHVGVAIALRGGGLVAPAIHHADTLALPQLMEKLQDLVARARAGTLRSSELSDGTITVTSLGERGVDSVLPIIYAPQTAIVGFGRIADRPWVVDGALAVRPLVSASLAADHRVTDGHLGARFLNLVEQLLQDPEHL